MQKPRGCVEVEHCSGRSGRDGGRGCGVNDYSSALHLHQHLVSFLDSDDLNFRQWVRDRAELAPARRRWPSRLPVAWTFASLCPSWAHWAFGPSAVPVLLCVCPTRASPSPLRAAAERRSQVWAPRGAGPTAAAPAAHVSGCSSKTY